ncbi:MAG: hypothetical protein AAFV07_03145 [Bacteroidota bacterium]
MKPDGTYVQDQTWRYLNGEMEADEAADFVREIRADEDMAEAVSEEMVRHYGRLHLKDRLELIRQQQQSTGLPGWIWWAVGGLLAGILIYLLLLR